MALRAGEIAKELGAISNEADVQLDGRKAMRSGNVPDSQTSKSSNQTALRNATTSGRVTVERLRQQSDLKGTAAKQEQYKTKDAE